MDIWMIRGFVLLWYGAWIFALLGLGKFIETRTAGKNKYPIAVTGMLGFLCLSLTGNLLNFFLPLGTIISTLLLLAGLALFLVDWKKNRGGLDRGTIIILALLAVYTSLFIFSRVWLYDTGLYHLPTINWLKSAPVPLGLGNLHFRLGFNSSWFSAAALMEPPREIVNQRFFIINPILMFFMAASILETIKNAINNKFKFSDAFLVLGFIPWLWHLGFQTASLSNNSPVLVLTFLLIYLSIGELERPREHDSHAWLMLLLALFSVTVKLSMGALALGVMVLAGFSAVRELKKGNRERLIVTAVLGVLLVLPWLARGVMLTGAPLFPSKLGYMKHLEWTVPEQVLETETAWIKSYARQPGKNPAEVLGNWKWLKPWFKRNFPNFKGILWPGVAGILVLVFLALARAGIRGWRCLWIPFSIVSGAVVFWFFSAPSVRFGYGFLHALALLPAAFGLYHLGAWTREKLPAMFTALRDKLPLLLVLLAVLFRVRSSTWLFLLLAAGLVFVFLKGGLKKFLVPAAAACLFITLFSNAFLADYLSKHLLVPDRLPTATFQTRQTEQGVTVHCPTSSDQCWDGPLLSTPYFKQELKIQLSKKGTPQKFVLPKHQ